MTVAVILLDIWFFVELVKSNKVSLGKVKILIDKSEKQLYWELKNTLQKNKIKELNPYARATNFCPFIVGITKMYQIWIYKVLNVFYRALKNLKRNYIVPILWLNEVSILMYESRMYVIFTVISACIAWVAQFTHNWFYLGEQQNICMVPCFPLRRGKAF